MENITINGLWPDKIMRIRSIAIWADEVDGFGLAYEVTPAFDPLPYRGNASEGVTEWSSRNGWQVDIRDDIGTEYDAPSGAFGLTPDGSKTHGTLDIYPQPPLDATWLEFTFHGANAADILDQPRFILRVNLPLPVLTDAEIAAIQGISESSLQALLRMRQEREEGRRDED